MLTEQLQQQRAIKWRIDGHQPVRTVEDARGFLDSVGFCWLYPARPGVLAPTFIGAVVGSGVNLPRASKAALDPRTQPASDLVARLLDARQAFEVPFDEGSSLLVSATEFPYFYTLLGERNPKNMPGAGVRGEKTLLSHTFRLIQQEPVTEQQMLQRLGQSITEAALGRALHELWAKLRIVRIGLLDRMAKTPMWDVLYRVSPEAVNRGAHLSHAEALSALISKYLETMIAAQPHEIEEFFGHFAPRSKVSEIVKALTGAREFESRMVGQVSMVRLVPREPDRAEERSLGLMQQKSLDGERRTPPDVGRNMVMRHDRRHPLREDRRGRARRPSSSRERKPTH